MDLSDASVGARVAAVHGRIAALHQRFAAPPTGTGAVAFDRALAATPAPVTATPGVAPADGDTSLGARAVALAKQQLGTPYVWGAETPGVGFDCSGLVHHTVARLGIDRRASAATRRAPAGPSPRWPMPDPGDLIAFGSPVDHIGIYAGGSRTSWRPGPVTSSRCNRSIGPRPRIRRVT